jgi:hypothetical protein
MRDPGPLRGDCDVLRANGTRQRVTHRPKQGPPKQKSLTNCQATTNVDSRSPPRATASHTSNGQGLITTPGDGLTNAKSHGMVTRTNEVQRGGGIRTKCSGVVECERSVAGCPRYRKRGATRTPPDTPTTRDGPNDPAATTAHAGPRDHRGNPASPAADSQPPRTDTTARPSTSRTPATATRPPTSQAHRPRTPSPKPSRPPTREPTAQTARQPARPGPDQHRAGDGGTGRGPRLRSRAVRVRGSAPLVSAEPRTRFPRASNPPRPAARPPGPSALPGPGRAGWRAQRRGAEGEWRERTPAKARSTVPGA